MIHITSPGKLLNTFHSALKLAAEQSAEKNQYSNSVLIKYIIVVYINMLCIIFAFTYPLKNIAAAAILLVQNL